MNSFQKVSVKKVSSQKSSVLCIVRQCNKMIDWLISRDTRASIVSGLRPTPYTRLD